MFSPTHGSGCAPGILAPPEVSSKGLGSVCPQTQKHLQEMREQRVNVYFHEQAVGRDWSAGYSLRPQISYL